MKMKFHILSLSKNPKSIPSIIRAKKHGIINPIYAYNAAKATKLDYALVCAILMRETSGGHNVFGHDPSIYCGAGVVNKKKYLAYKKLRDQVHKYQGVGPCQLTSPGLQNSADKIGGCWNPYKNMLVGFNYLHTLIKQKSNLQKGIEAYNGSGPAAEAYAKAVMASRHNWQLILSGKVKGIE